jgi:hypothetical protein
VVAGLNTDSFISLVLLWRGGGGEVLVTQVEEGYRLKGCGRATPPSASWAENTIMTECNSQESGGQCALLSAVFAVCTEQGKGSGSTEAGITLNTDVTRWESQNTKGLRKKKCVSTVC